MRVDCNAPILTAKGKPLVENGETITVGLMIMQIVGLQPEPNIGIVARKQRFGLSLKIINAREPIELDDTETTLIQQLLDRSPLAPLYSEQIALALEGKPNPLADSAKVIQFSQPQEVTS